MQDDSPDTQQEKGSGLGYALGAYLCWGFIPAYFKLLEGIAAVEIVAWRIVICLPICMAILALRGTLVELRTIAYRRNWVLALAATSSLIGLNWVIFIHAVNDGHVLATSLGYYLNPLLTVLLGRLVLRESLSRMQKAALVLAALGVALLASGALDTLWISVTLASSFALYGLVRKLTPVGSVAGLTVETAILTPIAVIALFIFAAQSGDMAIMESRSTALLLLGAGVLTAVPMFLFGTAARRLKLSTLGFLQYIAPTLTFLLGLFVYNEPFDATKLGSFLLIWTGIALVSGEAWLKGRRSREDKARAQQYRMQ